MCGDGIGIDVQSSRTPIQGLAGFSFPPIEGAKTQEYAFPPATKLHTAKQVCARLARPALAKTHGPQVGVRFPKVRPNAQRLDKMPGCLVDLPLARAGVAVVVVRE